MVCCYSFYQDLWFDNTEHGYIWKLPLNDSFKGCGVGGGVSGLEVSETKFRHLR